MNEFEIPTERDLPHGQLERRASHLVRELSARRRRRRFVLTLVPAVVILLTAATGFTAYSLLRTEPSHFESIGCYDRAALDANVTVVSADGRGAVAQCRDLWAEGVVGRPAPERLVACVLDTGPIAVFPGSGSETCEQMGLAQLSPQGAADSRRFVRMRDAIYARIGTPPSGSSRGSATCVGEVRAREIVRRALDAHGYGSWSVATASAPFSAVRPCAQVGFDGETKTAFLIATPR